MRFLFSRLFKRIHRVFDGFNPFLLMFSMSTGSDVFAPFQGSEGQRDGRKSDRWPRRLVLMDWLGLDYWLWNNEPPKG